MSRYFTSIASMTEAMARTLDAYQIDSRQVFESLGLDPEPFRNPDARIGEPKMKRLWEVAEGLTGNPCIGFEVGRNFRATNLHAVGYALLASSTIREGLERLVRYQHLLATDLEMDLREDAEGVHLQIDPHPGIDLGDDCAFTATIQLLRDLSHPEFRARRIGMMRPEPPCARELAEFFGCPVEYGADLDVITFSPQSIDERLARPNPALAQASESVAERYLAELDRKDVVARARAILVERLPSGEPSRSEVAAALHMSERTLARRLGERDYTFSALVDEVRGQLAREYLRQPRYSVTDVAFLLGFSDQSNFARAFRRWTQCSPREYRAQQLN